MDVAIAHDEQVVARGRLHPVQAVDLRIRIGRLAGCDQAHRDGGVFRAQFFDNAYRRVVGLADSKQNLEIFVLLQKNGAKILFELLLRAGQRFQYAD